MQKYKTKYKNILSFVPEMFVTRQERLFIEVFPHIIS